MRDKPLLTKYSLLNIPIFFLLAGIISSCTANQRLVPPPDPTTADQPAETAPVAIEPGLPDCLLNLSYKETARVVSITDGDTIVVEIDGRQEKLRYIGIDTPEIYPEAEPVGLEAADENRRLVIGKTVTLYKDQSETDRFGRLLRYVVVGDIFVNQVLAREGLADARDYHPDTACSRELSEAKHAARREKLGIWEEK